MKIEHEVELQKMKMTIRTNGPEKPGNQKLWYVVYSTPKVSVGTAETPPPSSASNPAILLRSVVYMGCRHYTDGTFDHNLELEIQ